MSGLRGPAVLLAALAALLAAGCGGTVLDDEKMEDTVEHNLKVERNEDVEAVDCPSGVEVEPKNTFECTVEYRGGRELTAELTIVDEDANVTMKIPALEGAKSEREPEQSSGGAG